MGSQRVWYDWVTNTHWSCVYDGTHTQVLWCGVPPSASSVSKNIAYGADSLLNKVLALYNLLMWNLGVSVSQFSRSVMSDFLQPHDSQYTRPPCPSLTPRVYSNSCPSTRWCHPAISSSVVPFSSCPQSLPASGTFPVSQLFTLGGQSIGVSASKPFWVFYTNFLKPCFFLGEF